MYEEQQRGISIASKKNAYSKKPKENQKNKSVDDLWKHPEPNKPINKDLTSFKKINQKLRNTEVNQVRFQTASLIECTKNAPK